MKILILFSEEEKKLANKLKADFSGEGIPVEVFPIKATGDAEKNIKKMVSSFFVQSALPEGNQPAMPTHVVILSALTPGWVDFLAGFSCGSHIQLLICNEEAAKAIPAVLKFCFIIFNTSEELRKYLNGELEIYKKIDADRGANTAREILLKLGIPVNEKSMVDCVNEGALREVMFFLAAGFSPDTQSKTGVPLLSLAARNGDRELVRFLYLAGAQINTQAKDRDTSALLDSVMGKHHDIMMDLLKAGAELNIQSKDGQTALVVATGAGDARMVEALLKAGANPDIADSMGMSARNYAELFHKNTLLPLFNA